MEGADWPLVGRGTACSAIVSAMGGDPVRNVVIAGPAGVGRTRLAREAVAAAAQHGRASPRAAGTAGPPPMPPGGLAPPIPAGGGAARPPAPLPRAPSALPGDKDGARPPP